MSTESSQTLPPQHQATQPGRQTEMTPQPQAQAKDYVGSQKLKDKVALITGGDSGIGRAVALCFAKEGAHVVIVYLNEHEDAEQTRTLVEKEGVRCLLLAGDVGDDAFITHVLAAVKLHFEHIDILVNNAAEQHPQEHFRDVSADQIEKTFRTNVFGMMNLTRECLPHFAQEACVINTTSVTAYRGSAHLVDYAATKGAIVAFTRSLALQLVDQGIRVNAVAPGPVWTPLIPSTFDRDDVAKFGSQVPMKRPGQPDEIAPSYVFLASRDASFMTGQVLHPNGGEVING